MDNVWAGIIAALIVYFLWGDRLRTMLLLAIILYAQWQDTTTKRASSLELQQQQHSKVNDLEFKLQEKERQHRDTLEMMKKEQNQVIKRLSLLEQALKK